jgi:hypothetical protein
MCALDRVVHLCIAVHGLWRRHLGRRLCQQLSTLLQWWCMQCGHRRMCLSGCVRRFLLYDRARTAARHLGRPGTLTGTVVVRHA